MIEEPEAVREIHRIREQAGKDGVKRVKVKNARALSDGRSEGERGGGCLKCEQEEAESFLKGAYRFL